MADYTYTGRYDPVEPAESGRMQRIINLAGAVISVALVIGLCIWGYKLAVRDVSGVPVVRAMEGPMRVAPDNPGGEVMAHQGLAVNEIAADGTAAGPADRLVLAPRPVELTAEDMAGTVTSPAAPVSARSEATPGLALETAPQPVDAITLAVAEATGGAVISDAVQLSGSLDAAPAVIPAAMPANRIPGPAMRPVARPTRLGGAIAPAVVTEAAFTPAPASAPASEVASEDLIAGTRLVQLGAFDTPEAARAEWDKLAGRFPVLREKARVIEPAQSGGRAFWRLRAHGFADEAGSRSFCEPFLTAGASCIAVAHQ